MAIEVGRDLWPTRAAVRRSCTPACPGDHNARHAPGTRAAPHRCVAMTALSNNVGSKVSVTAAELEAALHKALRRHPECDGIRLLKLKQLENDPGLSNWDAEFSAQPGTTISPDCRRLLISIKQGVQKHFDLANSAKSGGSA
jgi:hypothetical protein